MYFKLILVGTRRKTDFLTQRRIVIHRAYTAAEDKDRFRGDRRHDPNCRAAGSECFEISMYTQIDCSIPEDSGILLPFSKGDARGPFS